MHTIHTTVVEAGDTGRMLVTRIDAFPVRVEAVSPGAASPAEPLTTTVNQIHLPHLGSMVTVAFGVIRESEIAQETRVNYISLGTTQQRSIA